MERYFLPQKYFEIFLRALPLVIWKSIQKNHIIRRINEWWNSISEKMNLKKVLKKGGGYYLITLSNFWNLLKRGGGYYLVGGCCLRRHCKRILAQFEKMSLACWFWALFFGKKKCFVSQSGLKKCFFFDRQDKGW